MANTSTAANGAEMARQLKQAASQTTGSLSSGDAAELVRQLMAKFQADNEDVATKVGSEVRDLIDFIESAKMDIAEMRPATLAERDLPTAADELDAIVEHTEQAAGQIMDAADVLGEIANDADGDLAERINAVATQIFEASTFQDITGQRITKVVKVIKHIEDKLALVAQTIGDEADQEGIVVSRNLNDGAHEGARLANGPQMEGDGNSQDDIDALLASFD